METNRINNEIPQEEGLNVFGEIADFGDLEAAAVAPCGCACGEHHGSGQGA